MNKTARRVIDYYINHDIRTLVVGYNETFQKDSNIVKFLGYVNGALNIMRKSSVVDANIVYTVETKWTRNKNTEY